MFFLRNTHDMRGVFRGYDFFRPTAGITPTELGVVHFLDDSPKCLDEVFKSIKDYNELAIDAPIEVTKERLAFILIRLVEAKYAEVI